MKLLADLINVELAIEEEDKAVILLNSLPNEKYETFVLILINGKQTLNYTDVSAAFVNYEVRRMSKHSSSNSTTTETVTARGMDPNYKKGKGEFGKSKTGSREELKKNQCVFCRGHWKD